MATVKGGGDLSRYLGDTVAKIKRAHTLRVGFLETAKYEDGTPVAAVAAINNFGAPGAGIPARPFFTETVDRGAGEWGEKFAKIFKQTGGDAETALKFLGVEVEKDLREAIINMKSPPNAMVTNILKSRFPLGDYSPDDVWQAFRDAANGVTAPAAKPLVWSGVMLDSIESEVK